MKLKLVFFSLHFFFWWLLFSFYISFCFVLFHWVESSFWYWCLHFFSLHSFANLHDCDQKENTKWTTTKIKHKRTPNFVTKDYVTLYIHYILQTLVGCFFFFYFISFRFARFSHSSIFILTLDVWNRKVAINNVYLVHQPIRFHSHDRSQWLLRWTSIFFLLILWSSDG